MSAKMGRYSLVKVITEQKNWIAAHGGTEAAYIERYGSKNDEKHYGDGGEAIWKADTNALNNYLAEYEERFGEYPLSGSTETKEPEVSQGPTATQTIIKKVIQHGESGTIEYTVAVNPNDETEWKVIASRKL